MQELDLHKHFFGEWVEGGGGRGPSGCTQVGIQDLLSKFGSLFQSATNIKDTCNKAEFNFKLVLQYYKCMLSAHWPLTSC